MTIHPDRHPLAGQTVTIRDGVTDPKQHRVVAGAEFTVFDWADRYLRAPWGEVAGNPAAMHYGLRLVRTASCGASVDDEVLYGHIDGIGHLVHVTEIAGAE
jgi:hypothetical protein